MSGHRYQLLLYPSLLEGKLESPLDDGCEEFRLTNGYPMVAICGDSLAVLGVLEVLQPAVAVKGEGFLCCVNENSWDRRCVAVEIAVFLVDHRF